MDYYPLFLDIKNKPVLVVGGGPIALEKIVNLLKAGAAITVVAPDIVPSIRRFSKRVVLVEREFVVSDITTNWLLVYGATGDSKLNATISKICLEKRILCNTVDDPQYCHFIVPSIFRRGKLTVAISTAGVSPSLAKDIKSQLRVVFGPDYVKLTRWLVAFRERLKVALPNINDRKCFWEGFYRMKPLQIIQNRGIKSLDHDTDLLLEKYNQGTHG